MRLVFSAVRGVWSVAAWLWVATAQVVVADSLDLIGIHSWDSEAFVGLSGLEVTDDGEGFTTISDRGWFLSGDFVRQDGMISDITVKEFLPILGHDGRPVSARRVGDLSDAEGLAVAPDGTYWISFERWARVSRFAAPDQAGGWIEDHPEFYAYGDNRQLEALALHPDGTIYTLPERPLSDGFPIYGLQDGGWNVIGHLPERDGFSVVGADFDAAGNLYVLERKLKLVWWWQSRVRRLRIEAPGEDEILWTSEPGDFYNLEGIALWQDAAGLRITMVSDNNGSKREVTQFVEFRLSE